MSRQPKYRPECRCGDCPKPPSDRPPTLQECWLIETHDGWLRPAKAMRLAVERHVFTYVQWVNHRGWRKPRGYAGGRTPLRHIRPAHKPIFVEDYRKVVHHVLEEVKRDGTLVTGSGGGSPWGDAHPSEGEAGGD